MIRPLLVSLVLGGAVGTLLPHFFSPAQACSCLSYGSESLELSLVAVEQIDGDAGNVDAEMERWNVPMSVSLEMDSAVSLFVDPANSDLVLRFGVLEETP